MMTDDTDADTDDDVALLAKYAVVRSAARELALSSWPTCRRRATRDGDHGDYSDMCCYAGLPVEPVCIKMAACQPTVDRTVASPNLEPPIELALLGVKNRHDPASETICPESCSEYVVCSPAWRPDIDRNVGRIAVLSSHGSWSSMGC